MDTSWFQEKINKNAHADFRPSSTFLKSMVVMAPIMIILIIFVIDIIIIIVGIINIIINIIIGILIIIIICFLLPVSKPHLSKDLVRPDINFLYNGFLIMWLRCTLRSFNLPNVPSVS